LNAQVARKDSQQGKNSVCDITKSHS